MLRKIYDQQFSKPFLSIQCIIQNYLRQMYVKKKATHTFICEMKRSKMDEERKNVSG